MRPASAERGEARGRPWRGPRAGERRSHSEARAGHLLTAIALMLALVAIGTGGYSALEGMPALDALYMTVITLSTVGFREVRPLGAPGRVFTILLIVGGVGTTFYGIGALAEFLVAGRLQEMIGRRAMRRTLEALRDHVIICGFGRFGRVVAAGLQRANVPLVVIESDPALQPELERAGVPYVLGSALDDAVLEQAGLTRARALVAAAGDEAVNVFVALSAREANPRIAIHARAESEAGVRRLKLAGAHQVVSPHRLGGERVANAIVRPTVVDFMELTAPGREGDIALEEVELAQESALVGLTLRELPSQGIEVWVVAIRRAGKPIRVKPDAHTRLAAGDRVVVVGDRSHLHRLAELAASTPR